MQTMKSNNKATASHVRFNNFSKADFCAGAASENASSSCDVFCETVGEMDFDALKDAIGEEVFETVASGDAVTEAVGDVLFVSVVFEMHTVALPLQVQCACESHA